jgi:hypothetical protein
MSLNNSDSEMEVEGVETNNAKRVKLSTDVKERSNCDQCEKSFSKKCHLSRHKKSAHNVVVLKKNFFKCRFCVSAFARPDHRSRHEKTKHPPITPVCQASTSTASQNTRTTPSIYPKQTSSAAVSHKPNQIPNNPAAMSKCQPSTSTAFHNTNSNQQTTIPKSDKFCDICGELYTTILKENHEMGAFHKLKIAKNFYGDNIQVSASAFKKRIAIFQISNSQNLLVPEDFLKQSLSATSSILHDTIVEHTNIKYNMGLVCLYMMPKVDDQEEPPTVEISHFTKMRVLTRSSSIEDSFKDNADKIHGKMSEFQVRGSGWTLTKIVRLEVNVNQYNPLRGNSFIDLPKKIKNKNAIINIQNADEYCFAWAVNSALHEAAQHTERTSSYPHYTRSMSLGDIQFPMKMTDIKKFELLNPTISINVYGLEEDKVVGPYYHTKNRKNKHINLLYMQQGERTHYCYIKNMSG